MHTLAHMHRTCHTPVKIFFKEHFNSDIIKEWQRENVNCWRKEMCVGVVLDGASFSFALCELNLENVSAKTDQSHSDSAYYEKGTSFHPEF